MTFSKWFFDGVGSGRITVLHVIVPVVAFAFLVSLPIAYVLKCYIDATAERFTARCAMAGGEAFVGRRDLLCLRQGSIIDIGGGK